MVNSPVLDTVIGIVFIFLLYSLLATSINEAISTLFGFRARMLKKGIVDSMLSENVRKQFLWPGTLKTFFDTLIEPLKLIVGYKPRPGNKLGDQFYNHPMIRNYGTNSRFSLPSYLSRDNFSKVLIEVLLDYWNKHQADRNFVNFINTTYPGVAVNQLPTITKIHYLVSYLLSLSDVQLKALAADTNIDKDTLQILQLHLKKSALNLDLFTRNIENWYDDTMDRVSGWYKRQVQFVLFSIGLVVAIIFNVDVIGIAGKLSTDKDARDKLVELAIKEADLLRDDPRMKAKKKPDGDLSSSMAMAQQQNAPNDNQTETDFEILMRRHVMQVDSINAQLKDRIKDANNLMALGWGDYGRKTDSLKYISRYNCCYLRIKDSIRERDKNFEIRTANSEPQRQQLAAFKALKADTVAYRTDIEKRTFNALYQKKEYTIKARYVITNFYKGRRLLGYLLLGLGVCLGSPFWFDLLQKLVQIRATGKKQTTQERQSEPALAPTTIPVQVSVQNKTNPQAIG